MRTEEGITFQETPPGEEAPAPRRTSSLGRRLALVLGALVATAGVLLASGVGVLGAKAANPRVRPDGPVTPMNLGVGPANNSPLLVADPTDERFVVLANRLDAPDFGCALQVSGDAGASWTTANPVPKLPEGAQKCYAPEAAFAQDGTLYYLFVGLRGEGNEPMGAFLTTSRDRGRSFSAPAQVLGPLKFAVRMAIDPASGPKGRIHMVWLEATSDPPLGGFGPPPNPIMAAYSDDGGKAFSKPVQVSDPTRQRVVAPALALGPDHAVHVAYYDLEGDVRDYQGLQGPVWDEPWSLVMTSSTDGGRRFGPGVVVDAEVAPPERVMLIFTMPPPSLVAHRRRLCVAWTDARHGDADAFSRCSGDRGRTWDRARRMNDDALGNGRTQYLPRLAFGPDGRLDAIFYDRRRNPQNIGNEVFYTFSTDGGRNFASNVKLNREPSDSRIGQQYANVSAQGQFEFGSRLGLLARGDGALAAWTDTRNTPRLLLDQDVFAAEVHLSKAGSRRLVGAGLAVVGLVVIAAASRQSSSRRRGVARHKGSEGVSGA
ncbi:MAG TPA: sialidase family protein [Acidimicrobiales bacterium]|nr:sialidase family protein [Acidimicrobiales bacterium]